MHKKSSVAWERPPITYENQLLGLLLGWSANMNATMKDPRYTNC